VQARRQDRIKVTGRWRQDRVDPCYHGAGAHDTPRGTSPPIGGPRSRKGVSMADLAFVVLVLAGFATLALILRGLESL
jgi:hypothetical protein